MRAHDRPFSARCTSLYDRRPDTCRIVLNNPVMTERDFGFLIVYSKGFKKINFEIIFSYGQHITSNNSGNDFK